LLLVVKRCRSRLRRRRYTNLFERVINLWSSLPANRVDFDSFSCFKHSVKTHQPPFHYLLGAPLIIAVYIIFCIVFIVCFVMSSVQYSCYCSRVTVSAVFCLVVPAISFTLNY